MIATNAFKQAVVGTYSSSDTVIELDSISNLEGDADYLPNGGFKLILYDGLFGNPADANNAGKYEIWECVSVNYATSEVTVLRGQENTVALTIGAGASWQVFYGATKALFESLDHVPTTGSPTTFASGSIGNRKVDLYYTYDYVNGVWVRKPKDLSQEPEYILESIDAGLVPNDLIQTYGVLKANQDGGVIYFASGSMEVSTVDGRVLVDKWKPNTGATVEFTGTDRPELTNKNGVWSVDVEKLSKNEIRNNTMQGASVGSNTLPTNWGEFLGGLTREVVAIGEEDGWEYIDIRLHGTASSALATLRFEGTTQILASNGEVWTNSIYLKKISEVNAPNSYNIQINERTSGGSTVRFENKAVSPTTELLNRFFFTMTLSGGGTVERVTPEISFGLTSSSDYDFTVRLGVPQMEKSAYMTNVIKTSGTAVTRTAPSPVIPDALPATGVVYGKVDMVRDDSVSQVIFDSGGSGATERSGLFLNVSNQYNYYIFGTTGGQGALNNPFTWANNERKSYKWGLSYDADNMYLCLSDGVNTYIQTTAHDINTTTETDVFIGSRFDGTAHSSIYFTHLGKSTDIPTTAQEFQEIFERMP